MRTTLFTLPAAVFILSCVPSEKPDTTSAELAGLRADVQTLRSEVRTLHEELAELKALQAKVAEAEAQRRAKEEAEAQAKAASLSEMLQSAKDEATKSALQEQLRLELERAKAKCKPGFTADANGKCRSTPAMPARPGCNCDPGDPLCTCM